MQNFQHGKHDTEKYNTEQYKAKNNPNPNHCSSSLLLPVIKWFNPLKNTTRIEHVYTTRW